MFSHTRRFSDLQDLTPRLGKNLAHWRDDLMKQAKNHPVRTLAIVAGVGYVVGGGLLSRMTLRLVTVGMRFSPRFAWVPLVARGMISVMQGASQKHKADKKDIKHENNSHESNMKKTTGYQKGV